jgi:dynein heavy chain
MDEPEKVSQAEANNNTIIESNESEVKTPNAAVDKTGLTASQTNIEAALPSSAGVLAQKTNEQEIVDAEAAVGLEDGDEEANPVTQDQSKSKESVLAESITEKPAVVDYEKLLARFKSCIAISNFDDSSLTDDHLTLIKDFLTSPESRKLVLYIDDNGKKSKLHVSTSLPNQAYSEMAYFIRESSNKGDLLTENNFEHKVQFGKLTKNTLESLLRMMSHVYVPIFLGNKKWPDSVRKEFNNQLHKFMVRE